MTKSQADIENEIRQVPLLERLDKCIDMVGAMCAELRPPTMSIPPRASDEDEYIVTTLKDAIAFVKNYWSL